MSTATVLFIYLGAIVALMLILLFGWGVMIIATALSAVRQGNEILPAIKPLLDEW